ncbi:hypothetical protein NDI45_25320 [Leptolyngbya sp. GB1-A1]|uniref:hypothetical protein n=1 Tax=Leptolyngbya sp. GB1-A1 TaxID=2933908 RepID=UPI003298573D
MTAYFIFELKSNLEPKSVQKKVYDLWTRPAYGWDVDVYLHEKNGTVVCNLLYYFSDDTQSRERIEQILDYLFSIAIDGRVYYYRFNEAMDTYRKSSQKVTLDQLFSEYYPTLGGYCLRYEVARPRLKSHQNNPVGADS